MPCYPRSLSWMVRRARSSSCNGENMPNKGFAHDFLVTWSRRVANPGQLFVTVKSLHRITLIPLLLTLLFSVLAELTGLLLTLSEFLAPFLWLVFAASGIFHDVSSNAHAAILSVFQLRKTGCLTDFFTHTLGPHFSLFLSPRISELPSLAGSCTLLGWEGR